MECLRGKGYAVLPFLSGGLFDDVVQRLKATIAEMPEFKKLQLSDLHPVIKKACVVAANGFLANPSSFHNDVVRELRQWALPVVADVLHENNVKLAALPDRLVLRLAGEHSPGDWHRDEASGCLPTDNVYGGWVNLNTYAEVFRCIPGSQLARDQLRGGGGFHVLDSDEVSAHEDIKVPPGHLLVFNETIKHCVYPGNKTERKYGKLRLFMAWRTTVSPHCSIGSLHDRLKSQESLAVKSGQEPPTYGPLHWACHKRKVVDFSARIALEDCLEDRVTDGVKARVVKGGKGRERMPGLAALGKPYTAYDDEELGVYMPSNKFRVLQMGQMMGGRKCTVTFGETKKRRVR